VAPFDDNRVACVVEVLGMNDERAVKVCSDLHEQVLDDGIWSPPSFAARLVWIPLCLAPLDVGVHQAQKGGNVTSTEAVVRISNHLDVTHCSNLLWLSCGNPREVLHSLQSAFNGVKEAPHCHAPARRSGSR